MQFRPLSIEGAFEVTTEHFADARGIFSEWFSGKAFAEVIGHELSIAQANCSVSAAGVIRGIHFADVPPGQAKYVTCATGAVLDVVVDIRVGSETFGQWDSVLLDDVDRRAIYMSEGLGHAFMSLAHNSTVIYMCSSGYNPSREHGVHPLDPAVGIRWPTTTRDGRPLVPQLSDKDATAPSLSQALAANLLPAKTDVAEFLRRLGAP